MSAHLDLDLPAFMDGESEIPEQALRYLEQAGALSTEHGQGSFFKHLVETWSILRWWRADEATCLAGLFHSVYSTDAFPLAIVPTAKRHEVVHVIGAEAENLVHLFHRADRRALWTQQTRGTLPTREGQTVALSEGDLARLAIVEAANIAQQSARSDGAPTLWFASLASVYKIASPILTTDLRLTAVFGHIAEASEREALTAYLQVYDDGARLGCDLGTEERALLSYCHSLLPCAHEPLLWLALDAWNRDDAGEATRLATQAFECARTLGVSWDKRVSWAETLRLLIEMGVDLASVVKPRA
jgi:hypothetical protein